MFQFHGIKPWAAVAGVLLTAVACGGTGGGAGDGSKGVIEIGVEAPLSGTEASQGQPVLNGVQLAVADHATIGGFKIQVVSKDDAVQGVHDPQKGAQNVQSMVGDPKLLGFVGPSNSNVGKAEIPIAADNSLSMVSPANTNPCLTHDDVGCNGSASQLRKGSPNPYFRVVTTDNYQGPAAANYLFDQLKKTKVAVGSDNETYGKGIADAFAEQFAKIGGQVVKRQDFDWKTTDSFKTFLQAAKEGGAQAVYWGGTTASKACIPRSQMSGIFDVNTPYLGGDGIATDSNCAKEMGDMAPNVYSTIASIDPSHVPSAGDVLKRYDSTYGKQNRTGYAITGYDCAGVLLDAISRAVHDAGGKMPSRQQVRDQLAKTSNYQGILGPITFDQNGDNKARIISLYQYTSSDPTKAADSPWKGQYDFGKAPPEFKS